MPPLTAFLRAEDAVADIALFDDRLRVIAHAERAPWPALRASLSPGLYLVRTRVGTGCHEQYFEVRDGIVRVLNAENGDRPAVVEPHETEPGACVLRIPQVAFLSAAPLAGTLPHDPAHAALVVAHSHAVHAASGSGALLHVVAREAAAPSPALSGDGPLAGVRLNDMAGRPLVELGERGVHERAHALHSCNVAVTPGHYRLSWPARAGAGRELTLEQAMFLPGGWRLNVFLIWLPGDPLPRVSMHMTRCDRAFDAQSCLARASELLQHALSAARTRDASAIAGAAANDDPAQAPILDLVADPAGDPIAGVCAGWLLLRQGRLARAAHQKLLAGLRDLVDAPHPDVEALALAVSPDEAPPLARSMARPPMLDASWDYLVRRSAQWPGLVPGRSLAGEIATELYPVPLWLTWAARRATRDGHADLLTRALEDLLATTLARASGQGVQLEDMRIADLVAALGVPRGVVVHGLERLGESVAAPAVREVARALADAWGEKPTARVDPPRLPRLSAAEWNQHHGTAADDLRALIEQRRSAEALERLDDWERQVRAHQATDREIARGYNRLSTVLRAAGTPARDLAVTVAERALRLTPDHPASYTRLAEVYMFQGRFEAAEQVFRHVIANFRDDAFSHVGLARVLKARDKLEEAENLYRATIERFPDNEFAWTGMAEVLKAGDKLEEAEAWYREAIVRFPDNAVARAGLAEVLKVRGKFAAAEALYRETLARFPEDVVVHSGLGDVLKAQGKLRDAEAQYRDTVVRFPQDEFARTGLVKVLKAQDRPQEAEVQYRDTIARFPDNQFVQVGLGELLRAQGRLDEAEVQYRDTIARFPDNEFVQAKLGELLKAQGRLDEAEVQYRDTIARFPDNEFVQAKLGELLKAQGRLDEAEVQYRATIVRFPANAFAQTGLAELLKAQGRLGEAEVQYRDTIARFPESTVARNGLAEVLRVRGELDEAEAQYRDTIARFPDDEFARTGLAEVLRMQGRLDEAEAQHRDTIARFPDRPFAWTRLGEMLRLQGKLDEGEVQYRDTIARFPDNEFARTGLGVVLKLQGRLDEAEVQYRDTLARFPDNPFANTGLGDVLKAQGKLEEAEIQYRATISRLPNSDVARNGLAEVLKAQGKLDEAAARYRDTAALFPDDAVAPTGLAEVLKARGSLDEAEAQYRHIIAHFPDDPVVQAGLGSVLKAQGRLEDAEAQYRQTLARFPGPVPRNGLAEVLKARGKLDEAEVLYRDTIARFPRDQVTCNGLAGLLRRMKRWSEAQALVPEPLAWRTLDDHIKGHTRALILIAMGQHTAGIGLLERGLAEGWPTERRYFLSALAVARLRNRENVDQTLRALEQAVQPERTAVVPILWLHHYASKGAWPQAQTGIRELAGAGLRYQERAAMDAIDQGFGLSTGQFRLPDPAAFYHISEQLIEMVQIAA